MIRAAHTACTVRTTRAARTVPANLVKVPKRKFAGGTVAATTAAVAVGAAAIVAFTASRYKIAKPDEYLVRTGLGIKDVAISKKGYLWPFQKYGFIDMRPSNYTFSLHSMSNEKIPFVLPGVFTIGPKDDPESLVKYVRTVGSAVDGSAGSLNATILGILEGETRTLSSQMTMEEIFNDRKKLKEVIIENVQKELDQIGLWIYNANIKELDDSPESKYFFNMRQKKSSEAENNARVSVAEAKKFGDIGQKEREALTRQQVAQFEADTVLLENQRRQEIEKSAAALAVVQSEAYRLKTIADVEAHKGAESRETDLQRDVEQKRIAMETEKMRAVEVVKAQVQAEAKIKEAEGVAQSIKIKAEADFFAKQAEARGVQALLEAQANGLRDIVNSFNGDADAFTRYLMVKEKLYVEMARENARAIKGLAPKIVQWNTGGDAAGQRNAVTDILKMIPPVFTTIHEQTGIKPPKWLVDMETQPSDNAPPSEEARAEARAIRDDIIDTLNTGRRGAENPKKPKSSARDLKKAMDELKGSIIYQGDGHI